jgi:hypothetical protein
MSCGTIRNWLPATPASGACRRRGRYGGPPPCRPRLTLAEPTLGLRMLFVGENLSLVYTLALPVRLVGFDHLFRYCLAERLAGHTPCSHCHDFSLLNTVSGQIFAILRLRVSIVDSRYILWSDCKSPTAGQCLLLHHIRNCNIVPKWRALLPLVAPTRLTPTATRKHFNPPLSRCPRRAAVKDTAMTRPCRLDHGERGRRRTSHPRGGTLPLL